MKKWFVRVLLLLAGLIGCVCVVAAALYPYLTRTNGTVISSGEARHYLLYVPASYDGSRPVPLVISLHGAWIWPASQQRFTHWNALADKEGFIVVYPAAAGFPALWKVQQPGAELTAEVQFFADLIDALSSAYNIDRARVYANGFSNGAAMTFMLSCTLADRIAAFAMVATPVVPWEWCEDRRPVPALAIHGVDDPLAPYRGGTNFLTTEPLLDMPRWISLWGERNQCGATPMIATVAAGATRTSYSGCAVGSAATLYSLEDAGHIWPGGMRFPGDVMGPHSDSIDATATIWTFFKEHTLAATP